MMGPRALCVALVVVLSPLLSAEGQARLRGRRAQGAGRVSIPRGSWNASLQSGQCYRRAFQAATRVLRRQSGRVRLDPRLSTVVIPDLHGRRDYLDDVLNTRDPASGRTYLQLLGRQQVQVLCLGDVMHSEIRGTLWRRQMPAAAMRMEMAESLGTLKRIAELKVAFPEHFHLLRGNHDDVGPARGQATRLPRQIAATRRFVQEHLGQQLQVELAGFFRALPLAATGKGFVASHANPMFSVSRQEVERKSDRAAVSLARVRVPSFNQHRREATRGRRRPASALQQVARSLGDDPQRDLYIHGHLWARPMKVDGRQVYFGHPSQRTFLRLDPSAQLQPWNQLFEAGSGRRVPVPARQIVGVTQGGR